MARSSFRLWRIERKASAEKNEEFLMEMLDTDPGARYIGEFGIGSNMGITKFTRDIYDRRPSKGRRDPVGWGARPTKWDIPEVGFFSQHCPLKHAEAKSQRSDGIRCFFFA